jgi:phosphate/sulfate permease
MPCLPLHSFFCYLLFATPFYSSTLATVGAIAGVGVWEGRSGFNALLFVKMVSGWILTIIAAVSLTCECRSSAVM